MAAVDRELLIVYGTFPVGGTAGGSERLIHGFVQIDKSFTTISVTFDFVIAKESLGDFTAEVAAVEDAFREPFQDLLVTQGGTTLVDCRPSENTGLNTQPQIVKSEDEDFDTGRSRHYTVTVTADLPADNAPTVGVRDSAVNVSFSPSRRRTVSISGTVTAVGATEGRAEYDSIIVAFCTAILTALGGTFELAEEPTVESDYQDKTIQFSRVFDEIIFNQAPGTTTDNPQIVRQMFKVTRSQVGPGDASGAKRLVNLTASYEAWVDKNETMDLAGVWDSIKAWIYEEIRKVQDSGSIAIMDVSPAYDFDDNRISVSIQAVGTSGSNVLEHRESTQVADVFGLVLVPAWEGPYSKYSYQGPATRRRTTTTTKRVLGGGGGSGAGAASNPSPQLGNSVAGLGFQFGFGGGNPSGIGSLGAIGSQGAVGGSSFGFGQVASGGFSVTPRSPSGRGGGAGGGSTSTTGQGASIADLLGTDLSFVPISITNTQTPLVLGTDGKTFNVVDITTVLVEEGFEEVANKGGGGGGSTVARQGGL
jgi:hypothetical protein